MKHQHNQLDRKTQEESLNNLLLATDIVSKSDQETLMELLDKEMEAGEFLIQFAQDLPIAVNNSTKIFEQNLLEADLKEEEKRKTNEILRDTILMQVEKIAAKAIENIQKGEGVLYNMVLSERVIDILDIIQDFKKKLDKILPIPSDQILKLASPVLIAAVGTVAPGIAIGLKTSGIIEKAANFLDSKNLEKTMNKMKDDLAKIREDKKFDFVGQTLALVNELDISSKTINAFGLNDDKLKNIVNQATKNPQIKEFMQEASKYAEKILPKNDKDIDENLNIVKKSVLEILKEKKISEEISKKVMQQMDKSCAEAKNMMKAATDPKLGFFDKIAAQTKGAEALMKASKDINSVIKKEMPDQKIVADTIVKTIKNKINSELEKNVTKGLNNMINQVKDPKIKDFVKKHLGAGHANLISVEKISKGAGTSISK